MANEKYLDNSNYDFYSINLGKIKPFTSSKVIEKKIFANLEKLHPCFLALFMFVSYRWFAIFLFEFGRKM